MTFGQIFADSLQAAGLSQSAFCRKSGLGPARQPWISQIIKGQRTPPLDLVDAWADILGLTASERTRFIQLAHLAHSPDLVRDLVADLERKVAQAQENQNLIVRELRRRGIDIPGLSHDL